MRLLLLPTLVCLLAGPAMAADQTQRTIQGRVVKVSDGDTLELLTANRKTTKIRLNGIDAPETSQQFGSNAKTALSNAVFGKDVVVIDHGLERYGRTLGDVLIGGKSVNVGLVALGYAWHYERYLDDETLAAAQTEAKRERRGVWADDPNHVAPWDWRKLSKNERGKLQRFAGSTWTTKTTALALRGFHSRRSRMD